MLRTLVTALMFVLIAGGCATYRNDSLERMQTLPHHHDLFDARLSWDVTAGTTPAVINGVIRNIRYFEMNELEVRVANLVTGGKEINPAAYFIYSLKENEAAPFILNLPAAPSGSTLRFRYSYVGYEGGGDSGDALQWRQSFDWKVP